MIDQNLIRWKTDAWKSAEMVATYASRMHDVRGVQQLKTAVEVGLCRRFATGDDLLDVGVGTGRAAIPLAQAGYRVTGCDISQAMLDQCRREAGELPLELVLGDVAALPFGEATFDTVVSLNTLVHFPHWQRILDEWRRVVRPGGRIVFDVHALDHVDAVARRRGVDRDAVRAIELADYAQYVLRVAADEIFAHARERGLTVTAIVPYAAIYGGGNRNFWFGESRLTTPALIERLFSYSAIDPALFAFAQFLEEEVIGALTPSATGRLMVVLENRSDDSASAALRERIASVDALLEGGCTIEKLAPYLRLPLHDWKAILDEHLEYEPNRVFLAMLVGGSPAARHYAPLFAELPHGTGELIARVASMSEADAAVEEAVATWSAGIPSEILSHNGVDLAAGLSYDLTRSLMKRSWFDR